jgi:large subunit ribosomal protein L1
MTKKEETESKDNGERHGKKYQTVKNLIDPEKFYLIDEALELIEKTKVASFDPTVELHVRLSQSGLRGSLILPAGSAKIKKVLILDDENLVTESDKIIAGKIGFDLLLVKPEMMPKIAKLAKILGPRGLMPNPKSGTVSEDPKKTKSEIDDGKIEYKQDKANIIHLPVGKLSFGKDKLRINIEEVLKTLPHNKIKTVFINLTMGPSIALAVTKKQKA